LRRVVDWRPAFPDTADNVAAAVRRLLTEHGALTEDQLLTALRAAGVDLGTDPAATLDTTLEDEGLNPAVPLLGGRWAWLPSLLAGRVFTHRLTDRELAHDLLDVTPDLAPVTTLLDSESFERLADGAPVAEVFAEFDADLLAERNIPADAVDVDGALLLPPGYLARLGVAAGELVGVRVTPTGLAVEPVDEAAIMSVTLLGERLRAVLDTAEDEPAELSLAVWTVCGEDPALLTQPLLPLDVVIEAAGLTRDGEWLAPNGFEFDRWRTGNRLAELAHRHDLDDDEALAVLVTVLLYERVADLVETATAAEHDHDSAALADLYAQLEPGGAGEGVAGGQATPGTMRQCLEWLTEPAVAEAVLTETLGTGRDGAAALGLFAETLEPLAPRAARAPLRWLRGKALDRLGQVAEAEAAYEAAETADPNWPPTLIDLAHYASDRGDATHALALLHRAGMPDDEPLAELLTRYEVTPRSDLGRNQPCWCGSGRKYKQCHLGREQAPLTERSSWLYEKAAQYTVNGPWQDTLQAAARERSRFAETPQQLIAAIADPLVLDVVLFEGGAFAEFLATRGYLLPEDERLLADQWLLVDRSVHEVQTVRPGIGLTLRDVRTGDVHEVAERTASRQLTAGDLICARIVPTGGHDNSGDEDARQIFGGVEPVALHQRDELISLLDDAPDPLDLVALLTRRFAPPTLRNTEGEPLVLCEATLRTPDPAALTSVLDHAYDTADGRGGADTAQWVEHVTTDDIQYVRATLRLDGDHLRVHANSGPRLDRVLATLRSAQPAITVISESRQPAKDLSEAQQLFEARPLDTERHLPDPHDPKIAAALDQHVRDYEQRWLDEPIPALAGHTPRQCAADPTRRPDLIRLLDSFPTDHENPGLMSPDRIRAALNLI
jgi:tetratricopeptide (TPR) repeat protein